jgi:hypothetical protein
MKRFATHTNFRPLEYKEGAGFKPFVKRNSEVIEFKNRNTVEKFCLKNKCIYLETKQIFYR